MRKIVSNTTPIIPLLKIGKIEILKDLFGKIIVPKAVYEEIEAGKEKICYLDLKEIDWIDIYSPTDENTVKLFIRITSEEINKDRSVG